MTTLTLTEIARALGGDLTAGGVVAPGPGHSRKDRSLSIRPSANSPDGFICFSHAGDDFRECRDFVRGKLGLPTDSWRHPTSRRRDVAEPETTCRREVADQQPDHAGRIARAAGIWHEGRDARGTIVEKYLASRGLDLDEEAAAVVRYHPRCPWRDAERGVTIFVPALLAAMRQIEGDKLTAIHRTRLSEDGRKVDRRMLGVAGGAAIKFDPDDAITHSLAIGEGLESVLSGRKMGFRPAWSVASAGAITSFPVIAGIETLTLFGEHDQANARAVEQVGQRWHDAGREVRIIEPKFGKDLNDTLLGGAA